MRSFSERDLPNGYLEIGVFQQAVIGSDLFAMCSIPRFTNPLWGATFLRSLMPRYEHFDDLPAWAAAARLYNLVLDLFERHHSLFSPGYRNQLDRAALSVSNNIAEGFDRVTTAELIAFLGYARGSASEVRSMVLLIAGRAAVQPARSLLGEIDELAGSCIRQLAAWTAQIEAGPVQGKRHLTGLQKEQREGRAVADKFRRQFLLSIKPSHPLYNTPEAQRARVARDGGEAGRQIDNS